MPNLRSYQITGDTPDELEVSTESAAVYLNLKAQTLRKYRTEKLINIPYYKHPGRRGRVTYLVKDLRVFKASLRKSE
jgi:hypothetical protein